MEVLIRRSTFLRVVMVFNEAKRSYRANRDRFFYYPVLLKFVEALVKLYS
ncbi:hypothetical protein CLV24_11745 [Pontibacter ummariensis]|uniref:Uncharacterized protein n=1 Tax=Pontibacter ummariensis TaxID=1610492 RepID=A0A239IGR4_9BACT|nr:hypothetical protein CLV24_11745 [Pontibacter ummariensis]SNS92755.1 hypothetical protein SAMN06296052_11745 [Pontibacter ummariensis]